MKLDLVLFPNTNNTLLPGLLYEPDKDADSVLIYLHGNGSSGGFYNVELQNTFGKTLTDNNISYLTFTNTGGHLIQKFDTLVDDKAGRMMGGVAYERIKDCIEDIDGAINFLKKRGYKHIYLIGASTGANKICVYDYFKKENRVEKYILESGGDDSGLYYTEVGDKKFKKAVEICEKKIKEGKGKDLVPKYLYETPISYQSLYDQINPDGDYNTFPFYWQLNNIEIMKKEPFGEINKITKPTLVIYGEKDEFSPGNILDCVALIENKVKGKENFRFETLKDADHIFSGKRKELAAIVLNFLKE